MPLFCTVKQRNCVVESLAPFSFGFSNDANVPPLDEHANQNMGNKVIPSSRAQHSDTVEQSTS